MFRQLPLDISNKIEYFLRLTSYNRLCLVSKLHKSNYKKYFKEVPNEFPNTSTLILTCGSAINSNLIKYLYEETNYFKNDVDLIKYIITFDYFKIIEYLHNSGYKFSQYMLYTAAKFSSVKTFNFLHKVAKLQCTTNEMKAAIHRGNLNLVKYIHYETDVKIDGNMIFGWTTKPEFLRFAIDAYQLPKTYTFT